jgi:hypothetical protein
MNLKPCGKIRAFLLMANIKKNQKRIKLDENCIDGF